MLVLGTEETGNVMEVDSDIENLVKVGGVDGFPERNATGESTRKVTETVKMATGKSPRGSE